MNIHSTQCAQGMLSSDELESRLNMDSEPQFVLVDMLVAFSPQIKSDLALVENENNTISKTCVMLRTS